MARIDVFSQILGDFGVDRCASLTQRGIIDKVFTYIHPMNSAAFANEQRIASWQARGINMWGWIVCSTNQEADGHAMQLLQQQFGFNGWLLNIEAPLQGAKLGVLLTYARQLGVPLIASLAGASPAHAEYDYRSLDNAGVAMDWQCYFDSGEGPWPSDCVREFHTSSFVVPGWEYRHHLSGIYGWGRAGGMQKTGRGWFDSFKRPGGADLTYGASPREFGITVANRNLLNPKGEKVGVLMGRAPYPKTRVTLDVTRTAESRPAEEWEPIAATARVSGAKKVPVSVYVAERTSDDVLEAIARGAS